MIFMKMSDGGRVVIPVEIRRALGLNDGDAVLWELQDGIARVTSRHAQLRHMQQLIKAVSDPSERWSDALIAERRAKAGHEQPFITSHHSLTA
jgi:AbrB family looped-hinge helix DNA binding protein